MDIIMCGVGGQGTVLASRVIGEAAIQSGYQVRTSEIIGMAQREGSVVSQVRFDKTVNSPLIPEQGADTLLGFELAEAVRNLHRVKPGGTVLVNTQTIVPPSVYLGLGTYDEKALLDFIKSTVPDAIMLDAQAIAREAGNLKAVNAVLLGAFSAVNPAFEKDLLLDKLLEKLPEKVRAINTRAFELGCQAVKRQ